MNDCEKYNICLQRLWEDYMSEEDTSDDENKSSYDEDSNEYISDGCDSGDESDYDHPPPSKKTCSDTSPSDEKKAASPTHMNVDDKLHAVINDICEEIEEEKEDITEQEQNLMWGPVTGRNLKKIKFRSPCGIQTDIHNQFFYKRPYDFYKAIISDDIIDMMVIETNRYAGQLMERETTKKTRINEWKDTNREELRKFFAILIWMELCKFPTIDSYWSKQTIYENGIKKVMSRNRFQLILKHLHFSNNEGENALEDRLRKITPLLEMLKQSFKRFVMPSEYVCIGKTLVSFKGRRIFKKKCSNKGYKFDINLFKLCLDGGYTYDFKVYCGKEEDFNKNIPSKIVMSLMNDLLHQGRTLCTDDEYTSVSLAHELLQRKTHLIGVLRSNRKLNPLETVSKKLKRGETAAVESNTGVVVQKWRDKRDILMLSTRHINDLVEVRWKKDLVIKPKMFVDYNKFITKSFMPTADLLKSYNTTLKQGFKWYRKLALELLLKTAIINAYYLHQKVTNDKQTITKFREEIVKDVLAQDFEDVIVETGHLLEDKGKYKRRRCVECYANMKKSRDRRYATSHATRSTLFCKQCDKCFCLTCFFHRHHVYANN